MLTVTDSIKQLLIEGAPAAVIKEKAVQEGLVGIAEDGMIKVKRGITTPYEVLRNIQLTE